VVHFHFTAHQTEEHFEGLGELLPSADIFIPEAHPWTKQSLRDHNALAKGERRTLESLLEGAAGTDNEGFAQAMLRAIHASFSPNRSYLPIRFIDKPDKYTLPKKKNYYTDTIDGALHELADIAAHSAQESNVRDVEMVLNLGPVVSDLIRQHPKLRSKDTVKILCFLGELHTPVHSYLKEQPEVNGQLGVSYWRGLKNISVFTKIVQKYLAGDHPTRDELLEWMVATMLHEKETTLHSGGRLLNNVELVTFTPSPEALFGIRLLKKIMENMDSPEVQESMLHHYRKRPSSKDDDLLEEFIIEAKQEQGL
jgi:hypothetical protein